MKRVFFFFSFLEFYSKFAEPLRKWFYEQEQHPTTNIIKDTYRIEEEQYSLWSADLAEYLPSGMEWCPYKRKSGGKTYRYYALSESLMISKKRAIKKNPLVVKGALELISTIVVYGLPFISLPLDRVGRVSREGTLVIFPGSAIKMGDALVAHEMAKALEPFVEEGNFADAKDCAFAHELKRLLALDETEKAKALILAQVAPEEPAEPAEPDLCGIDNWIAMRHALCTHPTYKDCVELKDGHVYFKEVDEDDAVLRKARELWAAHEWETDLSRLRNDQPLFPGLDQMLEEQYFEEGQTHAEYFGEADFSEVPPMPHEVEEFKHDPETFCLAKGIEVVLTPQMREALWLSFKTGEPLVFQVPQEAEALFQLKHQEATKTVFSVHRGILLPCNPEDEVDWSIPEDADVMKRVPQSLERSDSAKRARTNPE